MTNNSTTPSFLFNPLVKGNLKADIVVVCEPQKEENGLPMDIKSITLFNKYLAKTDLKFDDLLFIQLCPPVPEEIQKSVSRKGKWVAPYAEVVVGYINKIKPKLVVTLGDLASRSVSGKALKFSSVRGTLIECEDFVVYPMTAPAAANLRLENLPILVSDIVNLETIVKADYKQLTSLERNYYWAEDISHILEADPKLIAIDTETTGLNFIENTKILTIQITHKDGDSAVCPINPDFWDWDGREVKRLKLISQIKDLLANPKVKKIGQNVAYDILMLRKEDFTVRGLYADTELWAWAVDENVLQKNLDNLCKIYLPEYAGYNDELNSIINKSDMMNVPKDLFLKYAGGDTCATYALFKVLDGRLKKEPSQRRLLFKVKMPILNMLMHMTHRGVEVDLDYLRDLKPKLHKEFDESYERLLRLVPAKVVKKHFEAGLKFSRDRFVSDIMFSKDGFNLKPTVFTETTKSLPQDQRVPSVSAKQHFPYFIGVKGPAGEFVSEYMEHTKLATLLSTYVDPFEEKYVSSKNTIHSSFSLARAVTGRTASSNPNSQNWPSRGKYAKVYKRIVKAREGYSFVSSDLSQIELRLVAHVANERNMIKLYKEDKDIHAFTARNSLGLTESQWDNLSSDDKKLFRFKAKAVNFGRIYGMSDKKYQIYAKTDYGLDVSMEESEESGRAFFNGFPGILPWHRQSKDFVSKHGYIVSIDGHVRHLPSVYSEDSLVKSSAVRQAINAPIQGTASNMGLVAMLRILRQGNPNIHPVLFIHDDDILEVKEGFEWEAANALCWCMANHNLEKTFGFKLKVPIKGEPDVGKTLGDMYELMDLPDNAPQWIKDLPPINNNNPVKPSWWDDSKDI
jgi:DNA polymerase-1